MRFSRQEYLSGLPFPTPRDLPWGLAGRFFTTKATWETQILGSSVVKNPPANAGEIFCSMEWQSTQYSCLENPMNRGAWPGYSPWGLKRVTYNLATKQIQHINKIRGILIISFKTLLILWNFPPDQESLLQPWKGKRLPLLLNNKCLTFTFRIFRLHLLIPDRVSLLIA